MLSSIPAHPGLAIGLLSGVVAAVLSGTQAGLLWFVVGYFVGKSLQSLLWTVSGGHPS